MSDPKNTSIIIQACDVEKSKTPITSAKPFRDILEQKVVTERNKKELENLKLRAFYYEESDSTDGLPNRRIEAAPQTDSYLINSLFHPFVGTMHRAYSSHYPLVISPDMIWLLIIQGFAQHVNHNSESLRDHFVNFEGKKLIDIRRDGFVKGEESNDWLGVFDEFSLEIEKQTGPELLDLVTANFSTTGINEKAAFQVSLMDAMKSYFTYCVTTCCGIPEIILEGEPSDWKNLKDRTQELAQFDLEWWIEDLMPLLSEIEAASEGKKNTEFWQSIYKYARAGSGSSEMSGWLFEFIPYIKSGPAFVKKDGKFKMRRMTSNMLPSGLSVADFIWDYYDIKYKMEFVSGFVGCTQDPDSLALRPEISWCVVDKQQLANEEELKELEELREALKEERLQKFKSMN